jgi:site-specific recombinase XerD
MLRKTSRTHMENSRVFYEQFWTNKGVKKQDPVVHIVKNKQKRNICEEQTSRPKQRWILDHPNAPGALD